MRIVEDTFKASKNDESLNENESLKESCGGEEYAFDISNLTGEEMLVLDELLAGMLVWGARYDEDGDSDRILDEIDDLFEKYYNRYINSHSGYQRPNSNAYEDDKAWMFAEKTLINHHLNSLENDTIKYYLEGKKLSDEQQSVLDKCMTVKQQKREPRYSVCDRYDFGPWTKYESVKSENLIDTEYSHTKDIAKDKEYFKNKYEKKGYKNVRVKKVKSDTKGLPMYEIYGDKEVNESVRINESKPSYSCCGIRISLPELRNRTTENYNILYENDDKIDGGAAGYFSVSSLCGSFDDYMEVNSEFRKLVQTYTKYVGDFLSSDREAAAFIYAVDELYPEIWDAIDSYTVNESLNESDNGERLGRWLGARLMSKWTAMLNVVGAEESPDYEFEESFDGNFVQCVKKLKEYQEIIDKNNLDAYLELESWNSGGSFTGDYDTIIDELYYIGYIYDDDFEDNDIDESLEESFNVSDETIEDAIEYYRENAFGFDGLKNYVETDFSHLPKEARDEIYKKMKKKLGESLNEFYDKGWQETGRGWSSDTYKIAEKVYEFLKDNDIWVDIYNYDPDSGEFSLEINGDWKHEHLRADWLIEDELKEVDGFRIEKIGSYPLEDSNDDSYRGVHQYRIINIEEENNRRKEMQEKRKQFEDSLVKKEVNGKEVYVSPDGRMFSKGYFQSSPNEKEVMWYEISESLNENCNSYQYKGKTIINAGDYWFVKGYKEKFPTSDEAEEFIDDKKKDEGVNINIRESLNKMDAESDNTYDLLNLYESKNLSRKQKKDIARMIYENYGLERIYNYLYEATEESEDELPVEDRVKELTNDFKNTNGSYVFEDGQDANKAVTILKSRGYDASQKRTQDGKYRVTADKKNK